MGSSRNHLTPYLDRSRAVLEHEQELMERKLITYLDRQQCPLLTEPLLMQYRHYYRNNNWHSLRRRIVRRTAHHSDYPLQLAQCRGTIDQAQCLFIKVLRLIHIRLVNTVVMLVERYRQAGQIPNPLIMSQLDLANYKLMERLLDPELATNAVTDPSDLDDAYLLSL